MSMYMDRMNPRPEEQLGQLLRGAVVALYLDTAAGTWGL